MAFNCELKAFLSFIHSNCDFNAILKVNVMSFKRKKAKCDGLTLKNVMEMSNFSTTIKNVINIPKKMK